MDAVVADPTVAAMRPEAKTFRVEDLVKHARTGRLRVPLFQRGFKWTRDDVENLFDSIWRGYPIGTLLLWSRRAPAERVRLGALEVDVGEQQQAWWVIDGQQRIVSLASTLASVPNKPAEFQLYFDLGEGRITHVAKKGPPPASFLPLDRLVDSEDLLAWIDANRLVLRADEVKTALRIGKVVREYEIPAYVVDVIDERVVRDIFERTNNSGKPLLAGEVFDALHASWDSHPPASLAEVSARLGELSFGEIDRDLILRSLLAVEGKDIAGDFRRELAETDVAGAVARAERALRRAMAFLAQEAGISHIRLLPYKAPLVALSVYFDRFPDPTQRARRLLTRWLWRGTVTEELGAGAAVTRRTLKLVADVAGDERAAQSLLQSVSDKRVAPSNSAPFNFRHAKSKLLAIAMTRLMPRHLETGDAVAIDELLAAEGDTIPQLVRTRSDDPDTQALLQTAGNRIIHPEVSGHSLLDLLRQQGSVEILRSHLITIESQRALSSGDTIGFVASRLRAIESHASQVIDSHAEWGHSDRVSLETLASTED
jgi:hypothetical protein